MKNTLSKLLAVMLTMALMLAPLPGFTEEAEVIREAETAEVAVEGAAEAVEDEEIAAEGIDAEVSEADFELSDDADDEWCAEDLTADIAEDVPVEERVPEEEPTEEPVEEPADAPADEAAEESTDVPTDTPAEEPSNEAEEDTPTTEPDSAPAEASPATEADSAPAEDTPAMPATEPTAEPAPEPVIISENVDTSAKLAETAPTAEAAVTTEAAVTAEAAPGVPTQVVRNKAVVYLNKGDAVQLVVAGRTIRSCKSGKRKVATVSKAGLVTARKKGKSRITVNLAGKGKKKIVVTVKVIDPTLPRSVRITNGKVITILNQLNPDDPSSSDPPAENP